MNRNPRRVPVPDPCLHRLRRQLFGGGAAIVLAVGGAVCLGRLLAGASPAELFAPAAGTLLALTVQWFCIDAALRQARRRLLELLEADGTLPRPARLATLRA